MLRDTVEHQDADQKYDHESMDPGILGDLFAFGEKDEEGGGNGDHPLKDDHRILLICYQTFNGHQSSGYPSVVLYMGKAREGTLFAESCLGVLRSLRRAG